MAWRSHGIEEDTKTWDKVNIDRKSDLKKWVDILKEIVNDKKIRKMFALPTQQPLRWIRACDGETLLVAMGQGAMKTVYRGYYVRLAR